jgi:hypothetical protein
LVPHMVELLLLRALEDRLALLRLAECGTGGPQRKVAIGHALRFTLHRRQRRLPARTSLVAACVPPAANAAAAATNADAAKYP